MPDLIRREEVIAELSDRIYRSVWEIDKLKEKGAEWTDAIKTWQAIIAEDESMLEYVKNSIEEYDTTIVRCKDCEHYWASAELCTKWTRHCGGMGYCDDAERRTDE